MPGKTIIAMSGGVDSSVAAFLMKQRGFECTGVTMTLFDNERLKTETDSNITCHSHNDIKDARSVCAALGIPHCVCNFSDDFREHVVNRFIETYKDGATPNPCVDCNRYIKFGRLFVYAKNLGMDYIVTGHYARIEYDAAKKRYLLKKAHDESKDQSYVLYSLTQEQLASIILPLGEFTKTDIRTIAAAQGFINAAKHDSQDICFVPGGDYARFIESYTGQVFKNGDFIDTKGNVLGQHCGIIRYTVGQRKGLGLSLPKPMYVKAKDAQNNTVTLCENSGLLSRTLDVTDFSLIAGSDYTPDTPIRAEVKIRYNHVAQPATVLQTSYTAAHIKFDEPQRAVAKGQAAVIYDGDTVLGGGTII